MSAKGTRRRIVKGREVAISREGKGERSIVNVTGLPPLSQEDARWLVSRLAEVVVMPSPVYLPPVRGEARYPSYQRGSEAGCYG